MSPATPVSMGKAVVVGEALVDVHVSGRTARLHAGGAGLNCAASLASLGVATVFAGGIGNDRLGRWLHSTLLGIGVEVPASTSVGAPTPLALVDTDSAGVASYSFHLADSALVASDPIGVLDALDERPGYLQIGGLALAMQPTARRIEAMVEQSAGRTVVSVDPNVRTVSLAQHGYRDRVTRVMERANVVKMSIEDMASLYPGVAPDEGLDRLLACGVELAVVTLGADGAIGATRAHRLALPAIPVRVVDTVGAGDAFAAALAAGLIDHGRHAPGTIADLRSDDLRAVMELASAAAALACTRAGACSPTLEDIARLSSRPVPRSRHALRRATRFRSRWRARARRP